MVFGRDRIQLAVRGSKCDQYGTCHGTEPIILPYRDSPLNAAWWIREILLRNPVDPDAREQVALFGDENGQPFEDATFAAFIMGSLRTVLGDARAKLYSPHSWRVWLASALRMCDASDARIQAMGRWLNPESVKIYARMTKDEYAAWVDKVMSVRHIDTARTTSLPIMDAADAFAAWGEQLTSDRTGDTDPRVKVGRAPLNRGSRLSVYWTECKDWYAGTYTGSRVEDADGGGKQRACCVVYDAVGHWATRNEEQRTCWHCLDDEQWARLPNKH